MTDIQTVEAVLLELDAGPEAYEAWHRVEAVVTAARMVDETDGEYRWRRVLRDRLAALDPTEALKRYDISANPWAKAGYRGAGAVAEDEAIPEPRETTP